MIAVARLFDALFSRSDSDFSRWHRRLVAQYKDHRLKMVGAGFVALLLTIALFASLPMTFQPQQNHPTSTVRIGLAPGMTLAETRRIADQTAAVIERNPNVDRVFERIFTSVSYVNVIYKKDRKKKSFEIERDLTPQLAQIADAQVNVIDQNSGGPGGGGRPINLFLGGDDPVKLAAVANQVAKEMESIPELVAPRVQGDNVRPEIQIKPRFDLAADLGVTTSALSQTVRIATIGDIDQNSAKFSLSDRQVPIIVSLPRSARSDLTSGHLRAPPTTRQWK